MKSLSDMTFCGVYILGAILICVNVLPVEGYSCGSTIQLHYGSSATLQSPNYPNKYYDNIDCSWTVRAPSGERIVVQFQHFLLESTYDYLYIGSNQYSGNQVPAEIHSSGNSLHIRFTTDSSIAFSGFQIILQIYDTRPPVISRCPYNIETTAELGTSSTIVNWNEPTATDDSGTPQRTRSHVPGTQFVIGITSVSYIFTDTSGNTATCDFSINVETVDTTLPEIIGCPGNIETTTELGNPATPVSWDEPTATDLSGTPQRTRSHAPGSEFPVGITTVRYSFTDISSNIAMCTFTITVCTVDTTAPEIVGCPIDIETTSELGTVGTTVNWAEPTATDLSGILQEARSHEPGTQFLLGETTVRYSFTDIFNNSDTCNFSVIVEAVDTTPPRVIDCPLSFDAFAGRHVMWTEPSASDISGNISQTRSHAPGIYVTETIPVVYSFTDSSGNSAYCNFTVNILHDITPPLIVDCPDDILVSAEIGDLTIPVFWSKPSATDQSGRVMLIDFTHVHGQHFPIGATNVVYTFADDSFNQAHCNFSVIIQQVDTTPPEIHSCPSDIVQDIELGTPGSPVYWSTPSATDMSGNTTLIFQSHIPGSNFTKGRTHVMYVFADGSRNNATCTFDIVIYEEDISPPLIVDCPADILVSAEIGDLTIPVFWSTPSATDQSGRVMLIDFTHVPGQHFPIGATNVVYTFADDSFNQAYCNFSVIIQQVDTTPPEIHSCPSDIAQDIELGTPGSPVYWSTPAATDMSGNATLIFQSHIPGGNFTKGRTPVMYVFADGSRNNATCTFDIVIYEVDTRAPSIVICPSDISSTMEMGSSGVGITWTEPLATDVSGNVTLFVKSHSSGDLFNIGSTTVVYLYTDSSNNMAICTFRVKVSSVDTLPPIVINCPSNIYESAELGRSHTEVSWATPSALDHHGKVVIKYSSHQPGDVFSVGSTTDILYVFADESNNRATCNFSVTVTLGLPTVDTLPPIVINCPSNIHESAELGRSHTEVSWPTPSALDHHGKVVIKYSSHQPGDVFSVGSTTDISYVFADESNNRATCNFSVTVTLVDTTPPVIEYCPDDITETIEVGVSTATVSWTEPRASDLSGEVTLSSKSRIPTHFPSYAESTVKYIFMDKSGNEGVCEFLVSFDIVDSNPPNIVNCPLSIHTTAEIGTPGRAVWWSTPFATDYSGTVITSSSHKPGHVFPVGSNDVVYQFEDDSSNQAECNFTVHVETVDTTPPVITLCPSEISETIELGYMGKSVSWTEPQAFDISGNVSLVSQSHFAGDYFTVGQTDVIHTFIDGNDNRASCNFSIMLTTVDTKAPEIQDCPMDDVLTIEVGSFGSAVTWEEPSAVDASGNVTLLIKTHSSGDWFTLGATSVTYVFVDPSNNIATCIFHIKIDNVDSQPPKILICPHDIHTQVEFPANEKSVTWIEPSAFDLSRDVMCNSTHASGQLFPVGLTPVSYTFTDASYNSADCTFLVKIDQVRPMLPSISNCPDDKHLSVEVGKPEVPVSWNEPWVSNSQAFSVIHSTHRSGSSFPVGMTPVSFTFLDISNNSVTCDFPVTISEVDTTPPTVINCPDNIETNIELGSIGSIVYWEEPKAQDISGNVTLLVTTHVPGTYFSVGTTFVNYVYRDNANNIASCTFSVTGLTVDTIPPVIYNCPSGISSSIQPGKHGTRVTWLEPFATDLSGDTVAVSKTYKPLDLFQPGSTSVVYTFQDKHDNRAVCNFTVDVTAEDSFKPDNVASLESSQPAIFDFASIWISVAGLGLSLLVGCCFISACILYIRNKKTSADVELKDLGMLVPRLEMETSSTF